MKFKHYLIVFIASFGMSFFLASCLNDDNKIPPNCYDGILNNGEEGIDCGGPCEKECDHCINGVWDFHKGETWRDCGGPCSACPQCANGIKDGDETGIDCGGSCGGCELLCGDGLLNGYEDLIDCEFDEDGVDESCPHCPTCIDQVMNGTEVGIDCGGTNCAACCTSGNCKNNITDGNEFWTDCGGSTCPDCVDTLYFRVGVNPSAPYHSVAVTEAEIVETDTDVTVTIIQTNLEGMFVLKFNKSNTAGQSWNLEGTSATLTFTDLVTMNSYISGGAGNTGSVVLLKAPTPASEIANRNPLIIPDEPLDGCHKPAGEYTFYRVAFSGKLSSTALPPATIPGIDIQDGLFQFTFKP